MTSAVRRIEAVGVGLAERADGAGAAGGAAPGSPPGPLAGLEGLGAAAAAEPRRLGVEGARRAELATALA